MPPYDELYKRRGYITNDGRCGVRSFYDNLARAGRGNITIYDEGNGTQYSINLRQIDIATDMTLGTLEFLHQSRRCMAREYATHARRTNLNIDIDAWERQELGVDWMSSESEIIPAEHRVGNEILIGAGSLFGVNVEIYEVFLGTIDSIYTHPDALDTVIVSRQSIHGLQHYDNKCHPDCQLWSLQSSIFHNQYSSAKLLAGIYNLFHAIIDLHNSLPDKEKHHLAGLLPLIDTGLLRSKAIIRRAIGIMPAVVFKILLRPDFRIDRVSREDINRMEEAALAGDIPQHLQLDPSTLTRRHKGKSVKHQQNLTKFGMSYPSS